MSLCLQFSARQSILSAKWLGQKEAQENFMPIGLYKKFKRIFSIDRIYQQMKTTKKRNTSFEVIFRKQTDEYLLCLAFFSMNKQLARGICKIYGKERKKRFGRVWAGRTEEEEREQAIRREWEEDSTHECFNAICLLT